MMNFAVLPPARLADLHRPPTRRAAAMGQQGGVAGRHVQAVPLRQVQLGHGLRHRHTDADALVVGQGDDAADAPAILRGRSATPCAQNATGLSPHNARKQRQAVLKCHLK